MSDKDRAELMIGLLAAMTSDKDGNLVLLDGIRTKPYENRDTALASVSSKTYKTLQDALVGAHASDQPHEMALIADSLRGVHSGFTGAFHALGMGVDTWNPGEVCPPEGVLKTLKVQA